MPTERSDRARFIDKLEQFRDIGFPTPPEGHRFELELLHAAIDAVVRGRVLLDCALIEELSAVILMHYWLATDRAFMQRRYFGRIKKYRSLFDALGRLPARQKMTVLKGTVKPKAVASTVERILAIRDLLAHIRTIDTENPGYTYKGLSIFSTQGFTRYMHDATACVRWFTRKAGLMSEHGRRAVRVSVQSKRREAMGTKKGQAGTLSPAHESETAKFAK